MRHSDSSPPIPPRFVAFAWRYHPSTCGFAPSDARCHVHGLGLGEPVPAPRRSLRWRRRGLPGSRETHTHACHALRPRRGRCIHGHSDATMWPSVQRKTSALATNAFRGSIRGLRTPCERFAPWVTPGPRITRFRLAAALGRMGLDTHRVSNKVSKITSRHLVPLDRASPGTRVGAQPFGCDEAAVGSLATVTAAGARSRHEIKGPAEVQDEVSRGELVSVRAGLGPARGRDAVALCRRHGRVAPVGLEFVIRPPLEAGPCPGSGRSNAHG